MLEINIDLSGLEQLQSAMMQAPEKLNQVIAESIVDVEPMIHAKIIEHPEPIPFPGAHNPGDPLHDNTNVQWDTMRQRVWYNHNQPMPYIRSDKLANAFQATTPVIQTGLVSGGVRSIESWVAYVKDKALQSNIHIGRWETLDADKDQLEPDVKSRVIEFINQSVPRIFGGG